MEKSIEYVQVMSNFESAYNVPSNFIQQPTMYIPVSSSFTSPMCSNRPSSPLFHRCKSPTSRIPLSTGSGPKFNFDLYKMNESNYEFDRDSLSSNRSISPYSSRRIYHNPIYSPLSSSISKQPTLSKLQKINDELSETLARSELTDRSPVHYHVHHYPLSQHRSRKYRSRLPTEERSSSTEIDVSPEIHKARVTYKVHMPRRHQQSSRHMPTSDVYSSDDRTTIDLYPTRDQGFVKQRRKNPDHQGSWTVNGTLVRRSSYSDTNTSQCSETPRSLRYNDKPVKSSRRSVRGTERPSSAVHHRSQHESVRSHLSSSRTRRPEWHPPSRIVSERPPKYFKHTLKPESDVPTEKHHMNGAESEPVSQRETPSNRTKVRTGGEHLKKPVKNSENNAKSTWEPTVIGLSKSTVKEPKPSTNTTTDRHSLHNESTKPTVEIIPKTDRVIDENHSSPRHDLSENQSPTSERKQNQDSSHSSPRVEKVSTPHESRKPSIELPKPTNNILTHENDQNNSQDNNHTSLPTSEVNKNENDSSDNEETSKNQNLQPTTPPHSSAEVSKSNPKTPSPKPNSNEKHEAIINDDTDENDQEVANSFDINKFLTDASKAILGPSKPDDTAPAAAPPPRSLPKPIVKSPPRRKAQPPSPSSVGSNQDLYNPPFGPKRKEKPPAIPTPSLPPPPPPPPPPAPPTTGSTNDAEDEDFFS
ncbi:unnamed protein product [Rotaria magnacalcarata]|uniref:Uncharacterized protein n=2 Tax=Rotaria magnacalcarata TaxID=392030 RepID=A0A819FGR7_9BILA|nr:unnamed protein product [Rotaria magnacalcarata]CAF3868189.1 unnamed protein product [Rotaria magnacalcarata]